VIVFAIAGILFVGSAVTSGGTDLRQDRPNQLRDLVHQQMQSVQRLTRDKAALRVQIDVLARKAGVPELDAAQAQAKALAADAGFTAVTGSGVEVVLTDAAPPNAALGQKVNPDDLLVHQQDVESVMNGLWRGGATAMTVQGRRLISTSAPQCVGNVILVDGVVYSPPYIIAATGNPKKLRDALDSEPGIQLYLEYVDLFGLGYTVTDVPKMLIPPYLGSVNLKYAHVVAVGLSPQLSRAAAKPSQ
jgi:uncharacterized protein YlxW (UPF0749 family)